MHDTVADGVVGALGGATAALGRGAEAVVARRPRPQRPLSATLPGGLGLAALNGLVGDRLERERSPLQEPISIRVDGLPVALERDELAAAYPDATPRLVVFVHGLMGNEVGWRLGRRQGREPYGTRLARELGCTPVYVRYNSGRHISENGRSLADLLEAAGRRVAGRGRRGRARRALDGRARLAQRLPPRGQGRRRPGSQHVRHVVSLGSPHLGAPLEQAAHVASYALGNRCPRRACSRPSCAAAARASATSGRARSSTRTGATAIPRRCAPRPARRCRCSRARRTASSPRPSPAARATRSAGSSATRWCSSRAPPGRSRTRKLGFEDEYGLHIGATNHIALLNHPAVYEKLREWLALADYPHVLDIPTRWKDNDVYGHVNNVEYYSYFDTVINRWLVTEGGLDIHAGAVIGLCVESHCAFKAAMTFPDTVRAGLRVAHLGRSSVRYEIGLFREDDAEPAAEGWFVHVFVDRGDRRPREIPAGMRAALERLVVS